MSLFALLIGVPLIAAFLVFSLRGNGARNAIVPLASAVTMVLSVAAALKFFGHPEFFKLAAPELPMVIMALDIIAALVILYYTLVRFKRPWIALLELVQLGAVFWFEKTVGHSIDIAANIAIDNFAMIMLCDIKDLGISFKEFKDEIMDLSKELDMEIWIQKKELFDKMHTI